MTKHAVILTGGKQFLVKENDEILVQNTSGKENDNIELDTLAVFDGENVVSLGTPVLPTKTKALVVANVKGDKVRISRFKAKVRIRKVTGFRPQLTKIKILSI